MTTAEKDILSSLKCNQIVIDYQNKCIIYSKNSGIGLKRLSKIDYLKKTYGWNTTILDKNETTESSLFYSKDNIQPMHKRNKFK